MEMSQTYNCINQGYYHPDTGLSQELVLQNQAIYSDIASPKSTTSLRSPMSPDSSTSNNTRRFENWPSQKIIMTGINCKTKFCIAFPTCVLLLMILPLLLGTAGLAVWTFFDLRELKMVNSQALVSGNEIIALRNTMELLEQQLKDINETYYVKIVEFESIFNRSFQDNVFDNISRDLTREIHLLTSDFNMTLVGLLSSLNNVTLSPPCSQEIRNCTLGNYGNTTTSYVAECQTESLGYNNTVSVHPTHPPISHTLTHVLITQVTDVYCQYTTPLERDSGYLATAVLHGNRDHGQCICSLLQVNTTIGILQQPNVTMETTCSLVATVCP